MIKKTLYIENPAYISAKQSQLIIKTPSIEKSISNEFGERFSNSIPIEDIGIVVLDNQQITITQGALQALNDNNCSTIVCDSNRMPCGLMLPFSGNTLLGERSKIQTNISLPLKKQLWQQTIQSKITNQALLLKRVTNVETGNMLKWVRDVRSGDTTNVEARAAVYYWANLFPGYVNFARDRYGAPPNNLLNYGYSILRSIIAKAIVGTGLLPSLGIHHKNKYNAFALADDIMEPFRPYVDNTVFDIVCNGLDYNVITKDIKIKLLSIPLIDVEINDQKRPLMIAASITTSSLFKCFTADEKKIAYPIYK